MRYRLLVRALLVVAMLAACAPTIDGPLEHQRTTDRSDAIRLEAQLAALPGVVRAEVMLRRPAADPLAVTAPSPAGASLVVIVDDKADKVAIAKVARELAHAVAPEVDPAIVVEVGAFRPKLAKVGPFTVEAKSKGPLRAALAIALATIALLAGWIALRQRAPRRPRGR